MQEKADLRNKMQALRDAMEISVKNSYDISICSRLELMVRERGAKTVHAYLPMGSEINITPLLEKLMAGDITIVTPKALKGRKMKNLALHSLSDLQDGIFGTRHPAHDEEFTGTIDLFIIPGLAFDKMNFRLGYGAGYYDTFLSSQGGYKVGICYPFQLVDRLPVEPHDLPMDEVIF